MRLRIALISFLALTVGGFAALSFLRGQERPLASTPPAPHPQPIPTAAPSPPPRDLSQLNELQKEILLSAQRGAEWLYRMNTVKGRFTPGLAPALQDVVLEGDHYLRQAGSAYALARAARFFREDRYTARATQTILALLDDTIFDPKHHTRFTSMPSSVVNRLASAGLLVLAINELPDPQADLLNSSEQLCNYIRRQARSDGSLADANGKPAVEDGDAASYPGIALYALMRSDVRRPAPWKTDLVRKAAAYYRPLWRAHKNMESVPWMTAALTEAYLESKDPSCAEFVFEMNDWLCNLQYPLDAQHERTWGGFNGWLDGRPTEAAPTIKTACYAEGLTDACRTARQAVDLDRYRRYQSTLQMGLQFVGRLQYTEGNTSHFAEWYRPRLVGGFHASQQDGNLRIDSTQFAVSALLRCLDADLR